MTTPNYNNPVRGNVGPRRRSPGAGSVSSPFTAPQQSFQPAPQQSFQPAPQQSFQPAPQQSFQPAPQQSFQPAPQQSFQPALQQSFQPAPPVNQMVPAPVTSDRSKISALLFAFFLGTFGAHNFYLGYKTKAWWQLGLTIFGYITLFIVIGSVFLMVTGAWAFIDFIMILLRSGSYGHDADGRPLR